jgi:hypothetical protein
MSKPLARVRIPLLITVAFLGGPACVCSAADETHVIYPPLGIFKEFCFDAEWSLAAIAHLAEQNSFKLVSSEDVPTPDGGQARKSVWEANTSIGPIGIIGVEGSSKFHGHTITCSVTTPSDSAAFVRSWLTSSFGDPTSTLKKQDGAMEYHWMHSLEDAKIDIFLLTSIAGQNSALLSIVKHK